MLRKASKSGGEALQFDCWGSLDPVSVCVKENDEALTNGEPRAQLQAAPIKSHHNAGDHRQLVGKALLYVRRRQRRPDPHKEAPCRACTIIP